MPQVNRLPARLGAAVLISGIIVSAVSAQSAPTLPAARQGVSPITGRAAVPAPQTMIHGTVLNSTGSPLANAAVRLRNLKTRQVEQVTAASQSGEFTFTVLPQIPYVVEIADNAGQVIAVGDVLVAQVGEKPANNSVEEEQLGEELRTPRARKAVKSGSTLQKKAREKIAARKTAKGSSTRTIREKKTS